MNKKTILIIEDTAANMKLVQRLLEMGGYESMQAEDGEKAVKLLESRIPDLILTDIELPRMDGLTFTKTIKQDPRFAKIPVIALSANASEAHKQAALEAGCSGYITKPFMIQEFLSVVQLYMKQQDN